MEGVYPLAVHGALRQAASLQKRCVQVRSANKIQISDLVLQRGIWLLKSQPISRDILALPANPLCETCAYYSEELNELGDQIFVCRRYAPEVECLRDSQLLANIDFEDGTNEWAASAQASLSVPAANTLRVTAAAPGVRYASQTLATFSPWYRWVLRGEIRASIGSTDGLASINVVSSGTVIESQSFAADETWYPFELVISGTPTALQVRLGLTAAGVNDWAEFRNLNDEIVYDSHAHWNSVKIDDWCGEWQPIGATVETPEQVPWILADPVDRSRFFDSTGAAVLSFCGEPLRPEVPRYLLIDRDAPIVVGLPPYWILVAALTAEISP